ncbi:hypothetical protein TWF696_000687 [Orbilia brochopaga]|uniref:JmjC domain-containing protein n=1 Tax=Orbilia brochopaga TaxID=3140254 RepID=A0AAV9VD87_9PEZI
MPNSRTQNRVARDFANELLAYWDSRFQEVIQRSSRVSSGALPPPGPAKLKMAPRQEAAPFVPISPTIDIPLLVSSTPNFKPIQRIDARRINANNIESLQAMIHEHVVTKGIPLVIENWHLRSDWPKWIFNVEWLKSNHGTDQVNIRDIPNKADIPMTFGHYLNNMAKLTSKFTPSNYAGTQQRLYGKDLDCPPVWRSSLANLLPESTFYLSTRADLMSSLPNDARAENMMCYVGHEGTYTPAHIEMCATLGQNIMISASQDGANSEKGSSLWFMTQMADRDVVAEYWLGTLGHDLSIEAHFASIDDLRNAPFTVYVLEQRVGDFVLVPPLAPHQVWNRGTYTVKAAWNRTTVETLEHALRETLPKIRMVCRDEQYKTRAIIYETLINYTKVLAKGDEAELKLFPPTIKDDYVRLFNLFTTILLDECFSPLLPKETNVELIPNEYNVTCSFCRGNIFNRFLSCKRCPPSMEGLEDDPYDVCMDCYARGRSCFCVSGLSWVEQHPWFELLRNHEKFRIRVTAILKESDQSVIALPQFSEALANMNRDRKSLARVCQEALQNRPFLDPNTIDEIDDEKEIAKKKREGKLLTCHPCGYRHPNWKAMLCTNKDCGKAYCFGNLWRAFDMDPFDDCLAKHYWKCPVCLGFCSCGRCRRKPGYNPYVPKGTILGAVTKHVADPRSVESLVDFGKGNVGWLTNGVSGGKRKRGEGDGENGDILSKWDGEFGAPDTAEPDGVNGAEEPPFPDEFNDRNIVAEPIGYKAHFGAAGLDVASIPIDPALGMGYSDPFGAFNGGTNVDYVKMFENPPELPFSPSRYHRAAEAAEGGMVHQDDHVGDATEADHHGLVHGYDGHPPSSSDGHRPPSHGNHAYPAWNGQQDTRTPGQSNLSTLEKNPLAFLAAAGLMHSQEQEDELASSQDWNHTYHDAYPYHRPNLHPTETFASDAEHDAEQDAPSEPYGLTSTFGAYSAQIDPTLSGEADNGKGKAKKTSMSKKERAERVQGDVEAGPVDRSGVAEWVKNMKSKKSRRKKGSLMVTLKISPEAWKRHEEQIEKEKEEKAKKLAARFGLDDVSTDLTPDPKRRRLDGSAASPGSTKKKGRPPGSRKMYVEVSDDEEEEGRRYNDLGSDDEEAEVMPKKTSRSTRTGELVDGLTFDISRRTSLNKSSRPQARTSLLGSTLSLRKNGVNEDADNESSDDDNEEDIGAGPSVDKEAESPSVANKNVGAQEEKSDDGSLRQGSAAYKAAIAKALQDAKRMALATAEGRSPPALSVYSSEAQSGEESEESDNELGFEITIGPRPTAAQENATNDEEPWLEPMQVVQSPPKALGNKLKPGLRPSKPLSKPGRPKKIVSDSTPTTPAAASASKSNGTPKTPAPTSTAKRGRPRKETNIDVTASLDDDVPSAASPPSKRARNASYSFTPINKAPAVEPTSKPRGRPKRNVATPTGSVSAPSPAPPTVSVATRSQNPTPKKPGRPPRKLSTSVPEAPTGKSAKAAAKAKPAVPAVNPTSLDASRSRNVIELLTHSPPPDENEEDDWF